MEGMQKKIELILTVAFVILISACKEDLPEASFFIKGEVYNAGDTLYFQNTSSNVTTSSWDFGDGTISQEKNPYHIYEAKGEYTIRLMVSNSDGSDEAIKTIEIMSRKLWQKHVIDDQVNTAVMVDTVDLDADGDLDLIATSAGTNQLIWYENNYPDWIKHFIDKSAPDVTFVRCADVDGNGTMDAIAILYNLNQLIWYENQNPSWIRHSIDDSPNHSDFIVVADINKDNKPDFATAGSYGKGGDVIWYENQYPNWIKHVIESGTEHYPCIEIIDIDGDGLLDVVGSMNLAYKIVWFRNLDNGNTWVKETIVDNIVYAFGLNAGDVNADGIPDLLVGTGGPYYQTGSELYLYENHYPNWTQITIDTDLDGACWSEVIDLNKDGHMDIIAEGFRSGIYWYENQETTWKKHMIDDMLNGPRLFIPMDVDGDSYIDIVATSVDEIVWYKHPGESVTSN